MIIQCPNCGVDQEFDKDYPYCSNCGLYLNPDDKKKRRNTAGENIKGIGIILFFLFVLLFFFVSRFYGGAGMLISFLIFLLGVAHKKNNNEKREKPEGDS
jgi:uncharacterized protein (DUF983 family)